MDISQQMNVLTKALYNPIVLKNPQLADNQYEILRDTILKFQNNLNEDEEVAVLLSSFGQSVLVIVNAISYSNPCLLHFHGFLEDGTRIELVQHQNQLNFLLLANKKPDPLKPARRIGF